MLREMGATYGRSPGGYIWAILEPVGAITMFTLVIAVGLKIRTPSIGTNFMLFYATGHLPYALFMQSSNRVAAAITYSRQLLRYPGVRYTDAIVARFLVVVLTQLMVFYIVMIGIHVGFDIKPILNLPAITTSLALSALLGLGIGVLNCYLFSVIPVWNSLWAIVTRPLFLLSTVIYSFEQVPRQYQDVVWFNPLIHVIGLMRRGFYPIYDAPYASPLYVLGFAMIPLAFGLIFLNRHYREIISD